MTGYDDIRMRYKGRLKEQLGGTMEEYSSGMFAADGQRKSVEEIERITSDAYRVFKEENMPARLGFYESLCNFSEKILKVKPKPEQEQELWDHINQAHLNITPAGALSAALVIPLLIIFATIALTQILFFLFTDQPSMFFILFAMLFGMAFMIPLQTYPEFAAKQWRLKASNQMILCIFYVVTYMRHTSNLEHAIEFASEHLQPPLSIDLKKVLWDVEMQRFQTVSQSLDNYLEDWKKYNKEFVEAFRLIQSSLFEGAEDRRISLLEKSLDAILDGTFEKMLHYAQNLKGPMTMLNMMGVIMPILGLVILPLMISFMDGVGWYHISALYNILLPMAVFYAGSRILASRPSGYGSTNIAKEARDPNYIPNMLKIGDIQVDIKPMLQPALSFFLFALIALFPLLLHFVAPDFDISYPPDTNTYSLLGYREEQNTGDIIGPFGLGSTLISLMLPLGLGLAISSYYSGLSKPFMDIRERTKKLETEFINALFQLGNRIGDGIPTEIAFSKVSQIMQGSTSGDFFDIVTNNLQRMGMGLEDSIFNEKVGALVYYPSNMIRSSMKVLIQSAKKGPQIASNALLNVARYVREIHRVNERLKDLMAEIVSSIGAQVNFLAPVIAGIVIGITSMISSIIGKLIGALDCPDFGGGGGGLLALMKDGVPSYYFSFVIGLYIIQITFILTILMNSIENGSDPLSEKNMLGKNIKAATLKYIGVAFFVILTFNLIAGSITGSIGVGCA